MEERSIWMLVVVIVFLLILSIIMGLGSKVIDLMRVI